MCSLEATHLVALPSTGKAVAQELVPVTHQLVLLELVDLLITLEQETTVQDVGEQ